MSTIFLIRHGKTAANENHLYCGSTDLPLSESGAKALVGLHPPKKNALYFTSGMLRTEQTLSILFGDVPHEKIPQLREIDFGVFEMHSYEALKDRKDYQDWISGDNRKNVPPGGESGEQMEKRVLAAFRQISCLSHDAVVITHGGVIAAIMAHLFPQENKNLYTWQPKPGCGYALRDGSYFPIP